MGRPRGHFDPGPLQLPLLSIMSIIGGSGNDASAATLRQPCRAYLLGQATLLFLHESQTMTTLVDNVLSVTTLDFLKIKKVSTGFFLAYRADKTRLCPLHYCINAPLMLRIYTT